MGDFATGSLLLMLMIAGGIGFCLGVLYGIAKRSGTAVVWGFWWPWALFCLGMILAPSDAPASVAVSMRLLFAVLILPWPVWRYLQRQ